MYISMTINIPKTDPQFKKNGSDYVLYVHIPTMTVKLDPIEKQFTDYHQTLTSGLM